VEKKEKTSNLKQRVHNRLTRGMNTKKRGPLWAIRKYKTKNDNGEEVEREYRVYVPVRTFLDPWDKKTYTDAQEPLDSLGLDWQEEFQHYAAEHNARIGKRKLEDGRYQHVVYLGYDY